MTADELLHLDLPGKSTELVRGHLLVHEPPGAYHAKVAARMVYLVGSFVYPRKLGALFSEAGFQIEFNPDTVRAPDLAFVTQERASAIGKQGYGALAPDLAVEIVSPGDRRGELLAKVGQWLDAGVRLVWVIHPKRVEAHVHRPDGGVTVVDAEGSLDGEDVLPGFHCPLADIFD